MLGRRRLAWLAAAACAALCASCFLTASIGDIVHDGSDAGASDASPDASNGGDASSDGFCAGGPHHDLCDDFDESPPFILWNVQELVGNGELRIDSDASRSPPSSLFARGPGGAQADLLWVVLGGVRSTTCAFDLQIDAMPTGTYGDGQYADLLFETPGTGVTAYNLSLHVTADGGSFVEFGHLADGGVLSRLYPIPAPALGQWTHVTWSVVLDPAPSVSVAFDGTSVLPPHALTAPANTGETFAIGLSYLNQSPGGVIARFDNVTCDVAR
jgi:hypothetical protein